MAELLASQTVIIEEAPSIRRFPATPTAVTAMVGITERGPVLTPTLVVSFEEYVRIFGGYIPDSKFPSMVEQAFLNKAQQIYISRVVHYTDILTPVTKTSAKASVDVDSTTVATKGTVLGTNLETFALADADTLDVAVDGGGATTATFSATAATRSSGAELYALVDLQTLLVAVDGGAIQTIIFGTGEFVAIGAATALEVAASINGKILGASADGSSGSVIITSDTEGTGSGIDVSGGTANGVLGFVTGLTSGTGNVVNIAAVTVAEVKTIVEAAVAGVTVTSVAGAVQIETDTLGSTGDIQVDAGSVNADTVMGLDNAVHAGTDAGTATAVTFEGKTDGAFANGPANMQILISDATNDEADEFNFSILRGGIAIEAFPNNVNDNVSVNDITKVLAAAAGGSNLVAAVFVASGRPLNGTFNMIGGNDGLAGLLDTDYTGSQAGGTGYFAFDQTQGLRLLLAPDRASGTVQEAGVDYCEISRDGSMFFVVTLPDGLTAVGAITHVETTFGLLGRSEYGATYWPGINVQNPSRTAYGDIDNILLPVTPSAVGIYAKVDGNRPGGVHDEPAGTERGRLRGVVSLETEEVKDIRKRNLVYPKRINPVTTEPGSPFFLDGTRVLKGDGNFPSIAQRRGVIDIEQNVKAGMEVFRHRSNDEETRDEAVRSIEAFLLVRFNQKAFRGSTPDTSFFVDADTDTLNPPSEVDAGRLNIRVGLATQRPIEFIVLRFSQDLRDAEAELAA